MKPVTKQRINITIDIAMFVVMVALGVIGFIIRYSLISGTERWEKYGQNVELTSFGLDRHQWGFIHLILGVLLAVLLVLHLYFHWSLIIALLKKLMPGKNLRVATLTVLLVLCAFMLFAPFWFTVKVGEPIRRQGRANAGESSDYHSKNIKNFASKPEASKKGPVAIKETTSWKNAKSLQEQKISEEAHEHHQERLLEIKGYHTFAELAVNYNISATELKLRLHIPQEISSNERLGRIRRKYGFTMSEVEECILALQKNK